MGIGVQSEKKQNSQPLAFTSTSVRNNDPASRNLRMRLSEIYPPSHLAFLSNAGIKGVCDYHPVLIAK